MSDKDNQELFEHDAEPQNALLDELDSLKKLLREQEQGSSEVLDNDIPLLDEVVADEQEQDNEIPDSAIPVLEEVSYPDDSPATTPQGGDSGKAPLPSEEELAKLVDMLIGHRLRRLRPKIKQEVLDELGRLYPDLFR